MRLKSDFVTNHDRHIGEAGGGRRAATSVQGSMPLSAEPQTLPQWGPVPQGIGAFVWPGFGGSSVKAPSTVTGRWLISVLPFFSSPVKGISVLPSDWSPQQRDGILNERESQNQDLHFLLYPKHTNLTAKLLNDPEKEKQNAGYLTDCQ